MRQEMGSMPGSSDRDVYIINEVDAHSRYDEPIDLRVRSVIERDINNNNFHERQPVREITGKNLILASLLTKNPSQHTQTQHNPNPQTYTFPRIEQNVTNRSRPLISGDMYLNVIPAHQNIPLFQGDNRQSIVEKLNIKRELTDEFTDHRSWNVNICHDQNAASTSSAMYNINSPSTSFRSVAPGVEVGVRSNSQNDKHVVPKYWKYHKKYSNQPSTSQAVPERESENKRNKNFDQYSIIRERLTSNPIIQPPVPSFNNLDPKSSHLYRLLQQRSNEHATQSVKRKSPFSMDSTNDPMKHKTLRCLLSAGKQPNSTNQIHFQGPSFYQPRPIQYHTIKTEIKTEPPDEDEEIQVMYQHPMRYNPNVNMRPQATFHSQVPRPTSTNVLKGLLVSNCKAAPPVPRLRNILPRPGSISYVGPDPLRPTSVLVVPRTPSTSSSIPLSSLTQSRPSTALPTSRPQSALSVIRHESIMQASGQNILSSTGPPSSGSPGSESTSSGSTDSGVFSDSLADDRRRVNRVMSGRHVKTGTGASITTLRLLRQMIIGRKNKNDRKL